MLREDIVTPVDQLIELDGSTTYFLERLRNEKLNISLEHQAEQQRQNKTAIVRTVKLYFDSTEYPILYCESELIKEHMSPLEYQQISEALLPIGKVFSLNVSQTVLKKNFYISKGHFEGVHAQLNISVFEKVYLKRYGLWQGPRQIARISEFFSEQTLARV